MEGEGNKKKQEIEDSQMEEDKIIQTAHGGQSKGTIVLRRLTENWQKGPWKWRLTWR